MIVSFGVTPLVDVSSFLMVVTFCALDLYCSGFCFLRLICVGLVECEESSSTCSNGGPACGNRVLLHQIGMDLLYRPSPLTSCLLLPLRPSRCVEGGRVRVNVVHWLLRWPGLPGTACFSTRVDWSIFWSLGCCVVVFVLWKVCVWWL